MKRIAPLLAIAVLATSCGSDSPTDSGTAFNEEAVIEVLRPGWPGLSDAELAEKAAVFGEACVELGAGVREAELVVQISSGRALEAYVAACPDLVAALD